MNMFSDSTPSNQQAARMRPKHGGGFTLIELLIALLVMMIGLLGVLSLFPVSLDLIKQTSQFSESSVLSASVHQALASGFHRSKRITTGTGQNKKDFTVVSFNHAGLRNNGESPSQTEKYTFFAPAPPSQANKKVNSMWLPCPESEWTSGGPCPDEDPDLSSDGVSWGYDGTGSNIARSRAPYIWQLGQVNDDHDHNDLHDLILDIRGENGGPAYDPGFRLDRYSFSILIRNRKTSAWPEGFYQVLIRIYHNLRPDKDSGGNFKIPRTVPNMEEVHRNLVREYRTMISR